jgi:hypothetical protein
MIPVTVSVALKLPAIRSIYMDALRTLSFLALVIANKLILFLCKIILLVVILIRLALAYIAIGFMWIRERAKVRGG